jgi:hypothetical protein
VWKSNDSIKNIIHLDQRPPIRLWAQVKTSLTPPFFIEAARLIADCNLVEIRIPKKFFGILISTTLRRLYQDRKVNANSHVFVCYGYRLCLFLRFWYLILKLFRQCGILILFFILVYAMKTTLTLCLNSSFNFKLKYLTVYLM